MTLKQIPLEIFYIKKASGQSQWATNPGHGKVYKAPNTLKIAKVKVLQ